MLDEEERHRRRKAYNQKYYAANREKFLTYVRRPDVKARRNVTRNAYAKRPEVRERRRELDRQRYLRPGVREKQREYKRKTGYASTKEWRVNNREKWNAYCRDYRRRKAAEKQAALEAAAAAEQVASIAHAIIAMETRHVSFDF